MAVSFAVAIAVPLALALFAVLFPYRARVDEGLPPLEVLKKRYRWWDVFFLVLYLFFAPVSGFAFWFGFSALAAWHFRAAAPSVFLLIPAAGYWALPSIFLATVVPAAPLSLAARLVMRGRYAEYSAYQAMLVNFDSVRVLKLLTAFIGVISLALCYLGLNTYARFTEGEMEYRTFAALGTSRRDYRSIGELSLYDGYIDRTGKRHARPFFTLAFADGTKWSTRSEVLAVQQGTEDDLVRFVSKKAGVQPQQKGLLDLRR